MYGVSLAGSESYPIPVLKKKGKKRKKQGYYKKTLGGIESNTINLD